MTKFNLALFLFLICLTTEVFAYLPKQGNVSATLGPFINKVNFEGSSTGATDPVLGGFGLIAVGDLSDSGSLEVAMIYIDQMYVREEGGLVLAEKVKRMHMTMGYRWWLNPYFSTSLGFYSSYLMGDYATVHSDFPTGSDFDTSARDTTEYGFDLSLQGEIWQDQKVAIVGDARYSISVTPKRGEEFENFGLLVGVRYIIQGNN